MIIPILLTVLGACDRAELPAPFVYGPFVDIDAEWLLACATTEEGGIYCFYDDSRGLVRGAESGFHALEVVTGTRTSPCAVNDQGSIRCWGDNLPRHLEEPPEFGQPVVAMDLSDYAGCAQLEDGTLRCWGYSVVDDEVLAPPTGAVDAFTFDEATGCAVVDTVVQCWGAYGDPIDPWPGVGPTIALDNQWDKYLFLAPDGTVSSWTLDASERREWVPGDLSPLSGRFVQVDQGMESACGITEQGQVRCWDAGGWLDTPDGQFSKVSVERNACAIDLDGIVQCWPHPAEEYSSFIDAR